MASIGFVNVRKLRQFFSLTRRAMILLFTTIVSLCAASPVSATDVDVSTVPFRSVRGFAVIVPVSINGSGPYDFLLDTGSTCTSVDRELGRELALELQGEGNVTTLVHRIPVSLALAHTVSVGPITALSVELLVRDLDGLRAIDSRIRGVLGQNALEQADYLLDYQHNVMQFDTDGDLLMSLNGERTPLTRAPLPDNPHYANLAVHSRITDGAAWDSGAHERTLLLDSGSASLVLFTKHAEPARRADVLFSAPRNTVQDVAGERQAAELRSVQLGIGGKRWDVTADLLEFHGASSDIDGLLPTHIFVRLYISNTGSFVMFEPKLKRRRIHNRAIAGIGGGEGTHAGGV